MLSKALAVNLLLFLFFYCSGSFSQDSEIITSIIDGIGEEDFSDQGWIDHLWELLEQPLNLNKASPEELLRIPFIDSRLARKIITYRNKVREIKNIEELLLIEGMSEELFAAIRPMLTVSSPRITPLLIYRIRGKLELPLRMGYRKQIYHNPFYLQQRILFHPLEWISGGILWEKDPGEANYFDYGSFYLHFLQPQQKYSVVLGDFYQRYGTGLVLDSPYGDPFSIHCLPQVKAFSALATGNKSSIESGCLRGLSLSYQFLSQKTINFFYSHNYLDGFLTADHRYFTSVITSGLHRTEQEIENKRNISEQMMGLSLFARFGDFDTQMGLIFQHHKPYYEKFPQNYTYQSIAYLKKGENFQPGGEYVLLAQKFPAFQQSLYYQSNQVKFEWIGYYHHPRYVALHGRTPGSMSSLPGNRIGSAVILNYRLISNFYIGGYIHFYRNVQLANEVHAVKQDYVFETGRQFNCQQIRLKFQKNYRPLNSAEISNFEKSREVIYIDYNFQLTDRLEVKNRIQLSWAKPLALLDRFYGTSLSHQISWKHEYIRITFRWSEFDIPDYDLRLYDTEPDVSNIHRSVLLSERGVKFLFLLQVNIKRKIAFDLMYHQRCYPDLKTVGSGWDTFPASQIHEIRFSVLGRI